MMQQQSSLPPPAMTFSALPSLTSTTAPGKSFVSRGELQQHYKSDWHRYNLKRREAGLPMLDEHDFTARLEAALALRREREGREERGGVDHRKDKQRKRKEKKQEKQRGKAHKRKPAFSTQRNVEEDPVPAEERDGDAAMPDHDDDASDEAAMAEEEGPPEINPCQSIFDNHVSPTPADNLAYLQATYSFYLPDRKYCIDLEGLLGYCNEKVRLGHICLGCQKSFKSAEAVLKHMRDKEHCRIQYERGVDQEEFDVFYDFAELNREIWGEDAVAPPVAGADAVMEDEAEDDAGWEDVDDGGEDAAEDDEDDEDDLYDAYHSQMASKGFDITPLGELIFPDGRIVGHRGLARYYKQRFAPDRTRRAAVRHAQDAAGDVIYEGRVVNVHKLREEAGVVAGGGRGRRPGRDPTGRTGKGILVAQDGGGFSALSLYRFRAVVKKQRRENDQGRRLQLRSRMNMNKMNKKGNNITTGVVTAMMPR